jgi:hypothetical protein
MKRNMVIGLATALVTAAGVAGGVFATTGGPATTGPSGPAASSSEASIAVLRNAGETTALPANGLDYTGLGVADPNRAVLIGDAGGIMYYAALGTDGRICLIAQGGSTGMTGGTCSRFSSASVSAGLLVPMSTLLRDGTFEVAALVADEVSAIEVGGRSQPVTKNFVVIDFPSNTTALTAETAAGPRVIDLGEIRPMLAPNP